MLLLLVGCAGTATLGTAPDAVTSRAVTTDASTPDAVTPGAGAGTVSTASGGSSVGTTTTAASKTNDPVPTSPSASPSEAVVPRTVAELGGRSFELVGLFTDAGGVDTMFDDARFVLSFGSGTAVADTQCGELVYATVRDTDVDTIGDLAIDLGQPSGPMCTLGKDPSEPPQGTLGFGASGPGEFYLSTGYVAWRFREL